ncbi:hypothetical protein SAMN02745866_00877 [Alteromonadaceae bacterium Bs31]|nr:hypothetical protein SAMN02745866_00877 [Alteromonadaceae bacterium Bs31]
MITIAVCLACGIWMIYSPKHMRMALEKYQLFLYKYFRFLPMFPFSNEQQAKKSILSERQIKLLGIVSLFVAIALLSRL